MSKDNTKSFVAFNILGAILALTFNFLAVSLPINNKTTGELSDAYPNYFVPAGFTFSIWGIIYLFMLGFIGYQGYSFFKKSESNLQLIDKIGYWFFANCMANALWIIAWHYEQIVLSLLIMFFLLFSLIKIYNILNDSRPHTLIDNGFIRLFFSIYLGWISVATIANVTTSMVSFGWITDPSIEASCASAMVVVAMILGVIMIFRNQDIAFALVIEWAIFGIYSKRSTFIDDAASLQVAIVSKYCMAMLGIYIILNLVGKRFYLFESNKSFS